MTPRYPLTVTTGLNHYYHEMRSNAVRAIDVEADLRTAVVEKFLLLDPTLNKQYVQGHVMAAWMVLSRAPYEQRNFVVTIKQPHDPFPELSREFLVGFVASGIAYQGDHT